MQLLRRAQEISGLRLPMLAFTFIRREFHHFAVAQVKSFVDVEHGPHGVISGNQFAQALERIAKRGRIHADHSAGLPRVHVHSKRLLRLEAFLHSEACCDGHVAFRNYQQNVPVHRRCGQLLRVRNLENQRLRRTSQRSKRRSKQNQFHSNQAQAAWHQVLQKIVVRKRFGKRMLGAWSAAVKAFARKRMREKKTLLKFAFLNGVCAWFGNTRECQAAAYRNHEWNELVLPPTKSYPAAVEAVLEIRAKQHNQFRVDVLRLIHGDLDPTSAIVFDLDAHPFFPIRQQAGDRCANRSCGFIFVEHFNSITGLEFYHSTSTSIDAIPLPKASMCSTPRDDSSVTLMARRSERLCPSPETPQILPVWFGLHSSRPREHRRDLRRMSRRASASILFLHAAASRWSPRGRKQTHLRCGDVSDPRSPADTPP